MPDEQLSDMIVDLMVAALQANLADNSALELDERVGVAKGGNLQSNPVKARIYVLVHVGDPDDPAWEDQTVGHRNSALENQYFHAPAFEIGGGQMWWRRFTIEFGLFATKSKEDRDEARRIANMTKGRIEKIIRTTVGLTGITDSLGEVSIMIVPTSSRLDEGGGPPSSFIWRGRIHWQVLTERPF